MNESVLVIIGGVIGAAVGSIVTGTVTILNALHKHSQERKATQFTEQSFIIERQEKHIARLDAQVHEQQEAIKILRIQHGKCREESAQMRVWIQMVMETMNKSGIAVEIPPGLLEREEEDAEFIAKTEATKQH